MNTGNARGSRWVTTMLALSLLSWLPATAAWAGDTPEVVVSRSIEAVNTGGVGAMADFMHPDELVRFKAMLMPVLQSAPVEDGDTLARSLFGETATAASVEGMPPKEFMRVLLQTTMSRVPGATIQVQKHQVLGTLREGELAHVVTRNTVGVGELSLTKMEVVSVKPYQDGWALLLSGNMEGMAKVLAAQRGAPKSP